MAIAGSDRTVGAGGTGPAAEQRAARALAARMFMGMLATQELLASYLGARLGLYESLADAGPGTYPEVAQRTGVAPRYAREWLEQQAVAGLLSVDDAAAPADERVYALPPGHAAVLTESDDPMSMIALTVLPVGGIAQALPALLRAYRTGDGVPDGVFGADWRNGHSGANRALFEHVLPGWIRRLLPAVHARLSAGGRVADVACGAGYASLALARAYPQARIHGLDLDAETIEAAARAAREAGVEDRVTFEVRDAADARLGGGFHLVCLFDALHEIAQPVEVLRSCRALRAAGGEVLVMDAKVATGFTAPGDEVERFQYGTSVLHCLPACLSGCPSAGTGTVMRVGTVREYALAAGFRDLRVLPVEERFHRLYLPVG
ncbi:MAG: class I SAM-dependent methyltransferase [Solirubrobacteraceae bacterium]